jgi:hypothetical protein
VLLTFSFNAFCCKPKSPKETVATEKLFIDGVLNKLAESEVYKNFNVISIKKITLGHWVRLLDSQNKKCYGVELRGYGTGSCEFTAEILSEKVISIDNCY